MDNPVPLAQAIENVTSSYLPKRPDYKTPLIVILLILVVALGTATVNYKNKYETVKRKLEKRTRKPGGLPKKDEDDEKIPDVEKEKTL